MLLQFGADSEAQELRPIANSAESYTAKCDLEETRQKAEMRNEHSCKKSGILLFLCALFGVLLLDASAINKVVNFSEQNDVVEKRDNDIVFHSYITYVVITDENVSLSAPQKWVGCHSGKKSVGPRDLTVVSQTPS